MTVIFCWCLQYLFCVRRLCVYLYYSFLSRWMFLCNLRNVNLIRVSQNAAELLMALIKSREWVRDTENMSSSSLQRLTQTPRKTSNFIFYKGKCVLMCVCVCVCVCVDGTTWECGFTCKNTHRLVGVEKMMEFKLKAPWSHTCMSKC